MSSSYNSYSSFAQSHQSSYGNAHDGGSCQDSSSPVRPGWVGVDCSIILLCLELWYICHLQDDDELQYRSWSLSKIIEQTQLPAKLKSNCQWKCMYNVQINVFYRQVSKTSTFTKKAKLYRPVDHLQPGMLDWWTSRWSSSRVRVCDPAWRRRHHWSCWDHTPRTPPLPRRRPWSTVTDLLHSSPGDWRCRCHPRHST